MFNLQLRKRAVTEVMQKTPLAPGLLRLLRSLAMTIEEKRIVLLVYTGASSFLVISPNVIARRDAVPTKQPRKPCTVMLNLFQHDSSMLYKRDDL